MINNQLNKKSLRIILWNANGLNQKESELLNFILENKINLALITENHYSHNSKHFFPSYNIYKTNHSNGTSQRGTAILISTLIQHHGLP